MAARKKRPPINTRARGTLGLFAPGVVNPSGRVPRPGSRKAPQLGRFEPGVVNPAGRVRARALPRGRGTPIGRNRGINAIGYGPGEDRRSYPGSGKMRPTAARRGAVPTPPNRNQRGGGGVGGMSINRLAGI